MPACPKCGSINLDDRFNERFPRSVTTGAAKRIDNTLRGLADAHGLSDISNTGGKAAKSSVAPPPQGKYGNKNYFGVDVPIGDKPVTVHGSSSYSGFKVEAGNKKLPGNRAIPTQVTAAHKGSA